MKAIWGWFPLLTNDSQWGGGEVVMKFAHLYIYIYGSYFMFGKTEQIWTQLILFPKIKHHRTSGLGSSVVRPTKFGGWDCPSPRHEKQSHIQDKPFEDPNKKTKTQQNHPSWYWNYLNYLYHSRLSFFGALWPQHRATACKESPQNGRVPKPISPGLGWSNVLLLGLVTQHWKAICHSLASRNRW